MNSRIIKRQNNEVSNEVAISRRSIHEALNEYLSFFLSSWLSYKEFMIYSHQALKYIPVYNIKVAQFHLGNLKEIVDKNVTSFAYQRVR